MALAPPAGSWTAAYQHDRRGHRHRCRCCNRILVAGETVIVTRQRKGTLAIHETCGERIHSPGSPATWADTMRFWGREWQRSCGYKVAEPLQQGGAA